LIKPFLHFHVLVLIREVSTQEKVNQELNPIACNLGNHSEGSDWRAQSDTPSKMEECGLDHDILAA